MALEKYAATRGSEPFSIIDRTKDSVSRSQEEVCHERCMFVWKAIDAFNTLPRLG
jgi:hypothetical protein